MIRTLTLFFTLLLAAPVRADNPPSKELATALQPFVDRGNLAGAVVLVADKEKTLAVQAVGFSDVAGKVPLTTDALFWIASQSKPITATALMILVDEGKVKLDDPVAKYLPEFNNVWLFAEGDKEHVSLKRPRRAVTVRDVLSHTSGLPFSSAAETPTLDGLPLAAAVKTYAMTPLATEPGAKYQYSNAGINTAGRIMEVVSKMPYEDFLQKRLFDPLGMADTTFWPSESQVKRLAKSYKPGKGGTGLEELTVGQLRYPLGDRAHRFPMPAGGLFSTAADVGRFCQMVLNGGTLDGKRILSEDAVKEMTKRQTPPELKESYGLGWSVGGGTFGHGGAFATDMTVDVKRGLVYVYLVQHSGFPGDGGKARDAFRKAAEARFAPAGK
ncbi:serine hydrolase domain-containing protein [Limnoglobus roseus]|uniref:Serine hydrolase n=1 Tax=Limnoglobus roseus TaxID=2598579 RepID=A0A5C1A9C8_9BACT|nr:serine hydrolase domain-containing protein [Limnoglobus roseus]QEL15969.1 serine hydrolase [Limnoglobus roseus]